MKLEDLAAAQERIEKGGWVHDLPGLPGVSIRARGLGNRDWRRLVAMRDTDPYRRDPEKDDREQAELLVRGALLDWRGLQRANGADLVFEPHEAVQLLSDPSLVVLRDAVAYAAVKVAEGKCSGDPPSPPARPGK